MRNVMTKAWKIARKGVEKFGGKAIEYISEALRIAWALVKKGGNKMDVVNGYEITERNYTVNGWEKYGHKRVYFEGYFVFNDHKVNAEKRVTFAGFFDAKKGEMNFQKAQARYEDFIKDVVKDEINEVVSSMVKNARNAKDEGDNDFGLTYEGY